MIKLNDPRVAALVDAVEEAFWNPPAGNTFNKPKPQHAPLDPHKQYSPAEVARILNVSYDTAIRRMKDMKGCIDLGSKETRHKRPKAKLRVSGKHLQAYLRNREL